MDINEDVEAGFNAALESYRLKPEAEKQSKKGQKRTVKEMALKNWLKTVEAAILSNSADAQSSVVDSFASPVVSSSNVDTTTYDIEFMTDFIVNSVVEIDEELASAVATYFVPDDNGLDFTMVEYEKHVKEVTTDYEKTAGKLRRYLKIIYEFLGELKKRE